MIETKNLIKEYDVGSQKVKALDGINLSVEKGEFISIMGPSGSGKTTLMNIIGCLDTPSYGTYHLNGKSVSDLTEDELANIRNEEIGFVFQSFHLLARNSALDNVMLPLKYAGTSKNEAIRRSKEALVRVGLSDRSKHTPAELSGGQQQRVAIARALAMDPKIMLFDEVTSALDPELVDEVLQVLHKLASNSDTTMLTVTHEMNFAKDFADRVLFFDNGQIVESGKPSDIFSNPKEERTRSFLKKFISNIN